MRITFMSETRKALRVISTNKRPKYADATPERPRKDPWIVVEPSNDNKKNIDLFSLLSRENFHHIETLPRSFSTL